MQQPDLLWVCQHCYSYPWEVTVARASKSDASCTERVSKQQDTVAQLRVGLWEHCWRLTHSVEPDNPKHDEQLSSSGYAQAK